MDQSFSLDHIDDIAQITIHKQLELEDFLTIIEQIASKTDADKRIWVVSNVFNFKTEEIRRIARLGKILWPGPSQVAYVASDELAYGLLRMFEAYRNQSNYSTRVFRHIPEALDWLCDG